MLWGTVYSLYKHTLILNSVDYMTLSALGIFTVSSYSAAMAAAAAAPPMAASSIEFVSSLAATAPAALGSLAGFFAATLDGVAGNDWDGLAGTDCDGFFGVERVDAGFFGVLAVDFGLVPLVLRPLRLALANSLVTSSSWLKSKQISYCYIHLNIQLARWSTNHNTQVLKTQAKQESQYFGENLVLSNI